MPPFGCPPRLQYVVRWGSIRKTIRQLPLVSPVTRPQIRVVRSTAVGAVASSESAPCVIDTDRIGIGERERDPVGDRPDRICGSSYERPGSNVGQV